MSHWNKLLKGSLVRWLLTERPESVEALQSFDHPFGYRFDPGSSLLAGSNLTAVLRRQGVSDP